MVEATVEERGNGSPEISWREHGLIVATGLVVWAVITAQTFANILI